MLKRIAELWCRYLHGGAYWPVNGRYICRRCHRSYPAWQERTPVRAVTRSGYVEAGEQTCSLEASRG